MKKKIIVLIVLFLLSGCSFYDEYEMPKEVVLKTKNLKLEVYSENIINDLIEDKNVEIINSKDKINTNSLGKKKTTIEYKYDDRKYKYDVNYEIVDTTAPIPIYVKDYYYTYVGDTTSKNINFCESSNFIDNYDRKPTCSIEGTYDVNVAGEYKLKYLIKDKSNNILEQEITFDVIEETEETDEDEYYEEEIEEEKIDFNSIIQNYKNDKTMIGIDVSRWQGDIDFDKVKKAGAEFVIMRMAVSNGPDDPIGLDSKFKQNIKNAKKAGLKVGVYIYTSPSTKDEIKKQAKYVLKELNKMKLDFPIAYDFENWEDIRKLKLNLHDLTTMVDEFYNIVKEDGYKVMIYGSKFYLEIIWNQDKYPIWLAQYIDQPTYQGKYIMWQLGNNGKIDGIDNDVDIDIYYNN